MTIEEKVKEYQDERMPLFCNYRDIDEDDIKDAFIDGAKWMRDKMEDKVEEQMENYLWNGGRDDFEKFMMEE